MAQDPWKKAYLLSQTRQAGSPAAGPPPPRLRRAPRWGCIIGSLLLLILAGGAAAAWYWRDAWLPRHYAKLPAPVKQAVPEPQVQVDLQALDDGLGVELTMFGDYKDFIAATREWRPEWKLSQGEGQQRLSAPGVKVYIRDGLIFTYELDIPRLFTEPAWAPWRSALSAAQLTPELSYTALTGEQAAPPGESEVKLHGKREQDVAGGWASAVYILGFRDNQLRRVVGGVDFGPVTGAAAGSGAADTGSTAAKH